MVPMLLDHTRDFVHVESFWHSPTDLSVISSATFLARWITHCCAPIFFFLAGLSVSLRLQAGHPMPSLRLLFTPAGLWLVALELTLVHLGRRTPHGPPPLDAPPAHDTRTEAAALGWPMAHLMGILFAALDGRDWRYVLLLGGPEPAVFGFRLYPLCRWFAGVKPRHLVWWLSYL